jgi:hypothetical protein
MEEEFLVVVQERKSMSIEKVSIFIVREFVVLFVRR